MGNILSTLGFTGLISALAKLGVNLTGKQYEYMKWRTSDEGKKYFSQEEDNRFYEALAKGDTTVMDLEIKKKQKEIDGLLGELGPLCILIGMLFLTGCSNLLIPKDVPEAYPESLLENEKTYMVADMKVKIPGTGNRVLDGKWHVVSQEFMKVHRRNQDNLLAALKAVKKERKKNGVFKWGIGLVAFVALLVGFRLGERRMD